MWTLKSETPSCPSLRHSIIPHKAYKLASSQEMAEPLFFT